MPTFQEDVTVGGLLEVSRGWSDWVFLRQVRDVAGGGGFVVHNPWGDSTVGQGDASRNRLELAYRPAVGPTHWGQFVLHGPTGNVGIGTVDPRSRLHVAGDVTVDGDVQLTGADCAEEFDLAPGRTAPAGTVVVLTDDGGVEPSAAPYDTRVAGVVSGAGRYRPGLVLDRRNRGGRLPIAMIGKVECLVDADAGPVRVGDLLTTSSIPGHAMSATDRSRAFGSVLGKALAPLGRGRQLLPVLVNLR